jgi:hypothetical protein
VSKLGVSRGAALNLRVPYSGAWIVLTVVCAADYIVGSWAAIQHNLIKRSINCIRSFDL